MLRRYIQRFAIVALTVLAIASCNKEIVSSKVINVTFHGYNATDMRLEVSVDTMVFDKHIQQANRRVGFSMVYPFPADKKEATLHVKDLTSGKEIFTKTLKLNGDTLEFYHNLVIVDDKIVEVKPPAADPATNKLSFYLYNPESTDPIDILMYNQNTGEQLYLAQNLVPQTWVHIDYLPTQGFLEKNDVESATLYFLKAGTFDWAFGGDEYLSQTGAFGWYIPYKNFNLNKVQPYFILPSPQGWGVEYVTLFPNPKKY
jgi:hypothetical protein